MTPPLGVAVTPARSQTHCIFRRPCVSNASALLMPRPPKASWMVRCNWLLARCAGSPAMLAALVLMFSSNMMGGISYVSASLASQRLHWPLL